MTYRWENILIHEDKTVFDALRVIEQEALRVGLVVNESQKLVGIISDGDVRRGILSGAPLDAAVSKVMNKNPVTMHVGCSRDELLEKMRRLDILAIPLIDDAGGLVGIQTLSETLKPPVYDNPVFIMAGGFGTRLRPLTDSCPKPMLKVGDKPILETLILSFKKIGFHNFFISTHYLPDVIHEYFGNGEKHDVTITYVHEDNPLGTGGALGLLPENMPDLPIILINGDVLTSIDFSKVLAFHNENGAAATMCVREYEYQVPYGVIESGNNKITGMIEKPIQRFSINAGIYVVGREMVRSVSENEYIDMPSLLEKGIASGKEIYKYTTHDYWLDIGRIEDFNKAQMDYSELGL